MARKSKIKWNNIYYMLTYAIDELSKMEVGNTSLEECKSLDDLLSALMCKAMELLDMNNYLSEYNKAKEITDRPHGNILMRESYSSGAYPKGKLYCEYFELSINSTANKIIKVAVSSLLRYGKGIKKERRAVLNNVIDDLSDVEDISITEADFDELDYEYLPEWYKPAIIVSKLIVKELLGNDRYGESRLFTLDDKDRLKYIFEKFVRNFYKQEYVRGITTEPKYKLHGGRRHILDMLIEGRTKVLVIDTKWYQGRLGDNRSRNMSQVYDYIGSYKENEGLTEEKTKKVPYGVVLYAMNDINEYKLNRNEQRELLGNHGKCLICERTIDLSKEFDEIKWDLIRLADTFLL